jgi:hypothetical protein
MKVGIKQDANLSKSFIFEGVSEWAGNMDVKIFKKNYTLKFTYPLAFVSLKTITSAIKLNSVLIFILDFKFNFNFTLVCTLMHLFFNDWYGSNKFYFIYSPLFSCGRYFSAFLFVWISISKQTLNSKLN